MKRYSNIILALCCVIGLSISIFYSLFYLDKPNWQGGVEDKIERATAAVDDIANQWTQQGNDAFIDKCWQSNVGDNIRNVGVSLYLFDGDSLRFWINDIYQQDIDSIFTQTSGIQQWKHYQILMHNKQQEARRAVVIVNLRLRGSVNSAIFDANSIEFVFDLTNVAPAKIGNIQQVNLPYCSFKMVVPDRFSIFWVDFFGWIGFFAGLVLFKRWMRNGANRSNALQRLGIFALIMVGIRTFVYYVDIPHGGSFSLTSLSSLLISQLFVMIVVEQAYHLRYKIRAQIESMSPVWRYVTMFGFIIFINMVIVYFHYAMVQTIYTYTDSAELYNILAVRSDTLFFYLVAAVFVAMRLIYGKFFATTFRDIPPVVHIIVSATILTLMVAPFEAYIGGTGYILILVHIVLVTINSLAGTKNIELTFAYNILIFAAYITLFSAIEAANGRMIMAERYATQIASGIHSDNSQQYANLFDPSSRLTYSIITQNEITLKAGNKFNAQAILPYLDITKDTIVNIGKTTHNIKRSVVGNSIIVVSYDKTTPMDIIALFAYIFIWLFIMAGILLEFSKIQIFKHYNMRSMLYRIRLIIFGVVIISLSVVCFVVYKYSGNSYLEQQRQLLNNSVQSLMRSFNSYPNEGKANDIILNWYASRGAVLGYIVNLYDLNGARIGGSEEHYSASRIYDQAYKRLAVQGQPYFDRFNTQNGFQITLAYMPLVKQGQRLGYMSVVTLNRDSVISRYSLLGNIFNIFIIIFLIAVILSLGLYNIISKPLRVLSSAMEGIGKLQKITITKDINPNSEVGVLLSGYNKMIDYLSESYAALARAEREGAWKEMARQVAHEIKNPLTPMRLKIQMLQRARKNSPDSNDAQVDSTLEVLLTQIDILNRIATEFSDLARMPQGTAVRLDLFELLRNTIALYSSNDCIKIKFEPQVLCGVFVEAEYAGLTRVVVNLLQNATQSINNYGTIEVRLRVENRLAIVEIEDSGSGIPDDMMERIFEPNFTTKSSGSGLGLTISRQIVENAGGKLSVHNSELGGAIFTIELELK